MAAGDYHFDATYGAKVAPHPGLFADCPEPNCAAWRERLAASPEVDPDA
jgi:hypothetical protein